MAVTKGYPSKERDLTLTDKDVYVTAEPIRENQIGSSVNAHVYAYEVGTDTCEANCTTTVLNLTAHDAKVGDIIRFTSGNLASREVKVIGVETDSIRLAETLSEAPSTDNIQILRHKYPVVNSDGEISVTTTAQPIMFTRNGADQEVIEDTTTPANNRPLPVKLSSVTGDINITAGDLNVALDAANDNVAISDGTNAAAVNASNELQVKDDDANTTLTAIEADTSSIDGKITACDTDDVTIGSELPAGTNNIGDVDVATIAAGTNIIGKVYITDGVDDAEIVANGLKTYDSSAATFLSNIQSAISTTNSRLNSILTDTGSIDDKMPGPLTPVDFLDSGLVDSSSTNITTSGVQVVSSLAADVKEIEIVEDIGEFMALTDGSDNILSYLPLGGGTIKVEISSGTALKLKSLTGSSITSGSIAMNLLG